MTRLARRSLLIAVLAAATTANAQSNWYHGFAFDAKTGCGPVPVDRGTFERIVAGDTSYVCKAPPRPWKFKDREGIPLAIINASFMADYSAASGQINRGSGVIEVRGVPVSPASVSANVAPDAHGGRAIASIAVVPITQAQVEQQLLDPGQMSVPAITLTAQHAELIAALRSFSVDVADFRRAYVQFAPDSIRPCEAAVTTPSSLVRCVNTLGNQIASSNICTDHPTASGCGTDTQACSFTAPAPWTSVTFACALRGVDDRIGELKRLRARLNEYSFGEASQRITTNAAQLMAKLVIYQDNLLAAEAAVQHAGAIYGIDGTTRFAPQSRERETMSAVRRAELKKQVKERYGASADEATLNRQVRMREESGEFGRYIDHLKVALKELGDRAAAGDSAVRISLTSVQSADDEVRNDIATLTRNVEEMNNAFGRLFDAINVVHVQRREPLPKVIAIDLRTGAGTNRVVLTTLKSAEHFVPYRFMVAADAPGAPLSAVQQGALFGASPNAQVVVQASNVTPAVDRNFDFQLHRMWDATVTGGFFASSLGENEFGTRTGIGSDTALQIGHRPVSMHYAVGITWFPFQEDTYPDTDWELKNRVGILLATAMDEHGHYYLGGVWEPRSGLNLSAGFHYGRVTVLQDGLPEKVLVASGKPAPTTDAMKGGVYVMLGLDLNIFRSVFGGTPSVPK